MTEAATVTYPPEMLPSPDEDEIAEVIVIHPDTGEKQVVAVIPPAPPHKPSQE